MRNPCLMTAVAVFLSVTTSAQTSRTPGPPRPRSFPRYLHKSPTRPSLPSAEQKALRRATASSDINWVECPPEAQDLGGLCGTLPVLLDRRHPEGKKIDIYFELYLHTDPGAAESALLGNAGGPGIGTTGLRVIAIILFAQNLDVHDILLIDDRGRGLSATIDCEELQHATARFDRSEADCAAQLRAADSWYGTGDVAMDTDAVRAALGYDKVDYLGSSYGGVDVTAYATRFGQHLRSIVLDAPVGTPGLPAFARDRDSARSTRREVRLDCLRSPTCAADHPNPAAEFDQLIQTIRNKPVQGHAYDANGNFINVRLDEGSLLYLAINPTGNFVSIGELLAAGDALWHGDAAPLLRLGAEVIPLVSDNGDPTGFSQGAHYATQCVDGYQPWDWSAPVLERKKQFVDALSDLPSDTFVPFSKAAVDNLGVSQEKQCLWWEKPRASSPVTPPHPTYPNVPTLVLVGDLDTVVPIEEVRKVVALFPGSTFVPVAEVGHTTLGSGQCAAGLASEFFETLHVGDTTCAKTPETVWPSLGRFPLQAADARPAEIDPEGHNEIGEHERKVVTVAVETAVDALKRSSIGDGTGVGLRTGTFESSFDADGNQITRLVNCAFGKDVTVNGTVVWGSDLSLVADLTVSGAGTAGGNIHLDGTWQAPGPVGNFKISGKLGGRQVAVLVPEA
ncbi:MAG: alpha/beta hydrolase [Acidobacteriia bacterium]|nr:alpha/beta hydrolase [Terriglobia bacterium]